MRCAVRRILCMVVLLGLLVTVGSVSLAGAKLPAPNETDLTAFVGSVQSGALGQAAEALRGQETQPPEESKPMQDVVAEIPAEEKAGAAMDILRTFFDAVQYCIQTIWVQVAGTATCEEPVCTVVASEMQ